MKQRPLSTILISTLGFLGAGLAYLLFVQDLDHFSVYLIPLGIALAILLVFKGQIDYWWYSKYPPPLDKPVIDWLNNRFPYYVDLSEADKKKFRERLALYLEGREFKIMRKEADDLPHDFRAMISSHAVLMTLHKKDFLIGDFDRIMCYQHAFPSPRFKFLHSVEVHEIDGMIILSTEHLLLGLLNPKKFLNIIFYAYAQALEFLQQEFEFPAEDSSLWERIEKHTGFTKEKISSLIGFEEPTIKYIMMSLYFTHSSDFATAFPAWNKALLRFFNTP